MCAFFFRHWTYTFTLDTRYYYSNDRFLQNTHILYRLFNEQNELNYTIESRLVLDIVRGTKEMELWPPKYVEYDVATAAAEYLVDWRIIIIIMVDLLNCAEKSNRWIGKSTRWWHAVCGWLFWGLGFSPLTYLMQLGQYWCYCRLMNASMMKM